MRLRFLRILRLLPYFLLRLLNFLRLNRRIRLRILALRLLNLRRRRCRLFRRRIRRIRLRRLRLRRRNLLLRLRTLLRRGTLRGRRFTRYQRLPRYILMNPLLIRSVSSFLPYRRRNLRALTITCRHLDPYLTRRRLLGRDSRIHLRLRKMLTLP